MIAESSKAFIFQEFAVKFYFGLSLHIFQHGSSLSLENVCDSWCMHQTGFSSAAVVPQSKFTELCSSAAVVSQSQLVNLLSRVARRPLCHKVNLPSCVARQPLCHKVNLPRCEARRRHLIMTCDIFGTEQTNTLTLCYLLGKTYNQPTVAPLSSHWNQHPRPNYWKSYWREPHTHSIEGFDRVSAKFEFRRESF